MRTVPSSEQVANLLSVGEKLERTNGKSAGHINRSTLTQSQLLKLSHTSLFCCMSLWTSSQLKLDA